MNYLLKGNTYAYADVTRRNHWIQRLVLANRTARVLVVDLEGYVRIAVGRSHIREPFFSGAVLSAPTATHQVESQSARARHAHLFTRVVRA